MDATPSSSLTEFAVRIIDRYGPTAAFLVVTLLALHLVYSDLQAQNNKLLAAFVSQAEASQKMAASVESLALAIRDNTAEMRSRFPLSSLGVKLDPVRSSLER